MLIISLKGKKALLKWIKFQNVCTFPAGVREKKFKPKDPGRVIWKIEHLGCLDSS